jgi:cold shock CspA family protein
MKQPLQISFRDMPPSESLEADIRKRAAKLDQVYDRIMSCRVVVEMPHGHHNKGKLYHVIIDLTVPGEELIVNRSAEKNHAHEDAHVAVRDAFNAARRQLQNFARRQRGDVKHHDAPAHGTISELIPMEDFGRINTADGREIYFHRNSVLDADFDKLEIGDEVRFDESTGDAGPQASTVHIVGKHHIVE